MRSTSASTRENAPALSLFTSRTHAVARPATALDMGAAHPVFSALGSERGQLMPPLDDYLGALRTEVEASLRKVESLVNDINRRWPFARDTEVKLP